MITLQFTDDEKQAYNLLYQVFRVSKHPLTSLPEIDLALGVLNSLKKIGVDLNGQMTLQPEGGSIELTDAAFDYLCKSVNPPFVEWTHQGLEIFQVIRVKLESIRNSNSQSVTPLKEVT